MVRRRRGEKMGAVLKNSKKPIPKTQIGLSKNQKDIMKRFIGKAPHFPVDLNKVREWEKYGDN